MYLISPVGDIKNSAVLIKSKNSGFQGGKRQGIFQVSQAEAGQSEIQPLQDFQCRRNRNYVRPG